MVKIITTYILGMQIKFFKHSYLLVWPLGLKWMTSNKFGIDYINHFLSLRLVHCAISQKKLTQQYITIQYSNKHQNDNCTASTTRTVYQQEAWLPFHFALIMFYDFIVLLNSEDCVLNMFEMQRNCSTLHKFTYLKRMFGIVYNDLNYK